MARRTLEIEASGHANECNESFLETWPGITGSKNACLFLI
jgi:hypothetical protein